MGFPSPQRYTLQTLRSPFLTLSHSKSPSLSLFYYCFNISYRVSMRPCKSSLAHVKNFLLKILREFMLYWKVSRTMKEHKSMRIILLGTMQIDSHVCATTSVYIYDSNLLKYCKFSIVAFGCDNQWIPLL